MQRNRKSILIQNSIISKKNLETTLISHFAFVIETAGAKVHNKIEMKEKIKKITDTQNVAAVLYTSQ